MKTSQSKVIKDCTYTVQQLPPSQALDLLMDLVKMVGPAFGQLLSGASSVQNLLNSDLKSEFIGHAVNALFTGLDKATVKRTMDALAAVTTITFPGGSQEGANLKAAFEAHFMGNLGALMQWLPFALKVQYDDFFSDLGSAIETLSPAKGKAPQA